MRISSLLLGGALLASIAAWAGPVDINSADARTIARELKGIGLARAQAIVDYRNQHGPFKSADELALVKGIGKKVIDENRANIRVERPEAKGTRPAEKGARTTTPAAPSKS